MLKTGIGPMSSVWKTEILTTELFKRLYILLYYLILNYFNEKMNI